VLPTRAGKEDFSSFERRASRKNSGIGVGSLGGEIPLPDPIIGNVMTETTTMRLTHEHLDLEKFNRQGIVRSMIKVEYSDIIYEPTIPIPYYPTQT